LTDPEDILQFWFGDGTEAPAKAEAQMSLWFEASPATDAEIRERFGAAVEAAGRGERASWIGAPRSTLALVMLLDQFPRNIWRGTARAFSHDEQALADARQAVAAGFLSTLAPIEQPFLALPFQHSESLDAQRESLQLCDEIVANAPAEWRSLLESFHWYAQRHRELIERFGRFPHRNAILGRESTGEELRHLDAGAENFGQG
jgi:uncharacterized protein (DUF924 family)